MTLASHPQMALVPKLLGKTVGPRRTWTQYDLELGRRVAGDTVARLVLDGPPENCRLYWKKKRSLYLEVEWRKIEALNPVVLIDNPPCDKPSTFVLNDDGSISPHTDCPDAHGGDPSRFALGVRTLPVRGRELWTELCVLVDRDDSDRLIFGWADRVE